jgi:hypothetical protein
MGGGRGLWKKPVNLEEERKAIREGRRRKSFGEERSSVLERSLEKF